MSTAISIKSLSFSYGTQTLFDRFSLDIEEGAFLGIIGPNGGGKSTLLQLIAGLLRPSSGCILLGEQPCHKALSQIAYVPQMTRKKKDFPISLWELVLMGRLSKRPHFASYTDDDRSCCQKLIVEMGLEKVMHNPFSSLSGGQLQRALIARALLSDPKVLLLDEATAHVDVESMQTILGILGRLKGKVTILLVTHTLPIVIEQVSSILCLAEKAELFAPDELCAHVGIGLYHSPMKGGKA